MNSLSKKKLTAVIVIVVLAVVVAACVVLMGGPKSNPGTSLTLATDKTEYAVGDTVTCTVTLESVSDLVGLKFNLALPEGLTYVEGSGKAAEGLRESMQAVEVEYVEKAGNFVYLGEVEYQSEEPTVLMTLECTVNENAAEAQTLGFNAEELECFNMENEDIECAMNQVEIKIVP